MLSLAVFGSGRGSNFEAILNAMMDQTLPDVRIALVVSNKADAGILALARKNDIPAIHCSQLQFPDESSFARGLLDLLKAHRADTVVLAGYLKKIPGSVIEAYRHRMLNIHPALLPRFGGAGMYGLRVHEAVIAAGERESGATVHIVDEEYDHGEIVMQRRVPVLPGDTPAVLAARVLEVEHVLYPAAIRHFAETHPR
jgi:phosphoribosylglycinamide formyltransferase 1